MSSRISKEKVKPLKDRKSVAKSKAENLDSYVTKSVKNPRQPTGPWDRITRSGNSASEQSQDMKVGESSGSTSVSASATKAPMDTDLPSLDEACDMIGIATSDSMEVERKGGEFILQSLIKRTQITTAVVTYEII